MALKHIARLRNNNCVSCLLWPLLFFDVSTVIAFRCTHSRVAINRNFRVSKIRLLFSSLMIFGLTIYAVEIGGRVQTATSMETKILNMAHLCFVSTQLSTFVFNIFLGRKTVQIFERYQSLLDDKFRIKILLSTADANTIRNRGLTHLVIAVCMSVIMSVKIKSHWDTRWTDDLVVFFGTMSLVLNVLQSMNEILLNYFLQRQINSNVKKAVKWKFANLEDELKLSRQFYGNLRQLIDEINSNYGLRFLIWYLAVLIVAIFDCFMLALKIFRGDRFSAGDLPVFMEIVAFGGIGLYFSCSVQKIDDVTNEILTFLFQCRVGKLTQAEALQLEALMVAMNVYKRNIHVMDIFSIGTKIIVPICGTIITYVLVVLQFYSAE